MKAKKIILAISFLALSGAAHAKCDKWKGEWFRLVWRTNAYISLFDRHTKGIFGKAALLREAESIVENLEDLRKYVENTESCEHRGDKYEKRKRKLLAAIPVTIGIMRAGELLHALK